MGAMPAQRSITSQRPGSSSARRQGVSHSTPSKAGGWRRLRRAEEEPLSRGRDARRPRRWSAVPLLGLARVIWVWCFAGLPESILASALGLLDLPDFPLALLSLSFLSLAPFFVGHRTTPPT